MDSAVQGRPWRIEDALWPPPAGLDAQGATTLAGYLAVPDAERPRFFLPADRAAAIAVLRHFRSDGVRSARMRIAVLRLAIRLTGGWPLARRVVASAPEPAANTIESYLAALLGPDLRLGVHLGPPRANRKPILQILGPDNQPRAFGKLGVGPLTRTLVARESEALRALADLELPGVRLPELVHAGDWGETKVLITTALPLAQADREVGRGQRTEAMVTIARAGGTRRALPGASSWLADRRAQAAGLDHVEISGEPGEGARPPRHHLRALGVRLLAR